jgi:hypothetical protein
VNVAPPKVATSPVAQGPTDRAVLINTSCPANFRGAPDVTPSIKEALLSFFEVLAYGTLLFLLPCVVAGLGFDWIVSDILVQVMLVAVACTAILTAIAIHEDWYLEHLSRWRLTRERVEPSLSPKQRSAEVVPTDKRLTSS